MRIIYQLVHDRANPLVSFHADYANCVAANPMSDRGQLLLEVYAL